MEHDLQDLSQATHIPLKAKKPSEQFLTQVPFRDNKLFAHVRQFVLESQVLHYELHSLHYRSLIL